jgi:diguanylate cyclase (GGDEF)-like protein
MAVPSSLPLPEAALPGRLPAWRFPLAVAALGLLTFAAAWYSLTLTRFDGGVATLCVTNGLLAGVLLVTARRKWTWWFLASGVGQLAVRGLHDTHMGLALEIVLINLLEAGLVAWWVRREVSDLRTQGDLGRMARDAVIATLASSFISATLALPLLAAHMAPTPFVTWVTWFSSHALGMVLVATLTVCALQPRVGLFGRKGHRVDYALCVALMVLVGYEVFTHSQYPLLFVMYLPLLLLVWRHGLSGMMTGVVLLAGASGIAAVADMGPFALMGAGGLKRVLFWNLYMAAGALMAYTTALALTKQRQLERRLLASEANYKLLAEEAEHLARFDALTGLANRRHFDEHLAEAVARAHRSGAALMLLAFDLDHFKQVNDTHGHAAGDAVLAEFAQRVKDCVYDVDLVARLGGDEFMVLVEYAPTAAAGERIARRVLAAMKAPFRVGDVDLQVSASIGIGLLRPVGTASGLMQLADRALYDAKSRGRATWRLLEGETKLDTRCLART